MNPVIEKQIKFIEDGLRRNSLMPAKEVDGATIVCMTYLDSSGALIYTQKPIEDFDISWQGVLKGKRKGDKIPLNGGGIAKVVAIFHIWG